MSDAVGNLIIGEAEDAQGADHGRYSWPVAGGIIAAVSLSSWAMIAALAVQLVG